MDVPNMQRLQSIKAEAQGVKHRAFEIPHLTFKVYLEHQDCPKAEEWQNTHDQDGFPFFHPVLHQRYNRNKAYLECEGCGTTIAHGIAPADDLEMA